MSLSQRVVDVPGGTEGRGKLDLADVGAGIGGRRPSERPLANTVDRVEPTEWVMSELYGNRQDRWSGSKHRVASKV